jgi:hypothetical protein
MILEEIAKKRRIIIGRNRSRIASLRARLASSARGAEVTPGSSGITSVCRRALVGVASELAGASVLDESESSSLFRRRDHLGPCGTRHGESD